MGIGKEANYAFMELYNKQVLIYPDACDEGIKVTGFTDPVCLRIKEILEDDFLTGAFTKHRDKFNYGLLYGFIIKLYIGWENADPGMTRATEWDIRYTDDIQNKIKYVSLQSRNVIIENRKL